MARLFFLFDDNRYNLLWYFTVTTIVLYLGPGWFFRAYNPLHGVPVVDAPCGKVAGIKTMSRDGRAIFSYRGMPYAEPPVGALRFKRPQPLKGKWEGEWDGSKFGSKCYQPMALGPVEKFVGSEDCLFLNVHVPNVTLTKADKGLPVMVYVHGGGFVAGDGGDAYAGPEFLLDRDVILVTMNYRIGPLGFFTLDNDDIGGNQGMWDQREALRWVQRNIRAFGGDPEKVTLFGESAGSMAVAYHMLSSESEGLFSAVIYQSGSVHMGFLSMDDKISLSHYHQIYAKELGCGKGGKVSQVDCLQNKTVEEVFSAYFMFDECNMLPRGVMLNPALFKPVNDYKFTKDPFFSNGDPKRALQAGKMLGVPVMIGFTKDEGLITTLRLLWDKEKVAQIKDDYDACMAQNVFGILRESYTDVHKAKIHQVTKEYAGRTSGVDIDGEDFGAITDLYTDCGIAFASEFTKRMLTDRARNEEVYYYRFDHQGSTSVSDFYGAPTLQLLKVLGGKVFGQHFSEGLGVSHADDLLYIFKQNMVPVSMLGSQADEDMSRVMVDLWANFATYRKPTPKYDDGAFVGEALARLEKPWRPAKLGVSDGTDMALLKNGGVAFEKQGTFQRRHEMWTEIFMETGHVR